MGGVSGVLVDGVSVLCTIAMKYTKKIRTSIS